ncbi:MAG: phage tail sheath subtilisin-like domain-containing protein [Legionella sp.]|uniref:phage tail sheath C-terminal domain-containing protein n=1 Tax=Legionella sp. TaxID=459 RepID=UPI00284A167F|nr:phage tail sheath subtilisin-like domain-containing protein [Legionella sp.]
MPNYLSPAVSTNEIDLTTIIPAVSTSVGAFAGVFQWGPVGVPTLVSSETDFSNRFGYPSTFNGETWFVGSSFLSYSAALLVSRAANTTTSSNTTSALTAIANVGTVANLTAQVVLNVDNYYNAKQNTFDTNVLWVAKYPGSPGNSLRVSVCDSQNAYSSNLVVNSAVATGLLSINAGSSNAMIVVSPQGAGVLTDATSLATSVYSSLSVGDQIYVGNSTIGTQYVKVATLTAPVTVGGNTSVINLTFTTPYRLASNWTGQTVQRYWEFYNNVTGAPGQSTYQATYGNTAANDEVHVVVVDQGGYFSSTAGTVLEVFAGVSRANNAVDNSGNDNYYADVINGGSQYIWFANDRTGAFSATAQTLATSTNNSVLNIQFVGGSDGPNENAVSISDVTNAYNVFNNKETTVISLVLAGKSLGGLYGEQLGNYLIDNIASIRKDCVVFVSPNKSAVVNNKGQELTSILNIANQFRDTSYGVMDSGYKYMYDKYNDVYRWIPLNGDIAGLCAQTDDTNAPWWSPAGYTRGNIKNVIRLAYNPSKPDRDQLYSNRVNPVVTFPGKGTILYGDKTLQAKPSAFDRINVRRLFIVLENAISTAAQYSLFEFNDDFTRSQFRNLVTPYLRSVQGGRGITAFLVKCDTDNNPGSVVDANQFVGDIYIKPARSINWVNLNFIAVGTDVSFSTVVGSFGG